MDSVWFALGAGVSLAVFFGGYWLLLRWLLFKNDNAPRHFFKPSTHWHEVSRQAYETLKRAGYGKDRLK